MKRFIRIALVLLAVIIVFPSISFANTEYIDWESTTALPTTTGAYKLKNDVTITKAKISTGNNVTLDLNGYKVTFDGTSSADSYLVQYGATLTIEDSSADGSGLMINTGNSYMIHTYGDCIINGGTIESTTTSGRAIFVQGSSGKIATCTLNDGIIRNSLHNGGRAVVVGANAIFTMNNGKVENKGEGTYGTVKAIEGGNIIINGGTVEAAGTAIYSNVETIITGGTIKAGWFAFETRDAIIEPADGKIVNVIVGKNAITTTTAGDKASIFLTNSMLSSSKHGNKVLGGNFDAPRLVATSSLDDNNLELQGGVYTPEVTGVSEYLATDLTVKEIDGVNYVGKESKVTVKAGLNGKAVASEEKVFEGQIVKITITPDENYEIATLKVTDAAGTEVAVKDNTFTMPTSDVTVEVTFKEMKKDSTPATGSMNILFVVSGIVAIVAAGMLVSKKYAKNN